MKRIMLACAFMAILCSEDAIAKTQRNTSNVRSLVAASARENGIPASFALAIANHESGFSCSVVGRAGERGVMQIKPSTARAIGYKGSASGLSHCQTGIYWGMKYLKMAVNAAKGDLRRAAFYYNAGIGAKSRNPHKKSYVTAIFRKKVLTE